MTHKKLLVFVLLIFLLSGFSNLYAANYSILFSDQRTGGWSLAGYTEWESPLSDPPGLKIGGFQMYLDTVVGPNQYWDEVSGITNPYLLNGQKVTWTVDGVKFGGYIPSEDDFGGYPGLFNMPLSYDVEITSPGNSPTVSWSNDFYSWSGGFPVTGYRVRILESGSSDFLLDYTLNSANADMTSNFQTFDFTGIFDFAPHTDYIIRIEARLNADLYGLDGKPISVPHEGWAGIVNRSIVTVPYSYATPIPSSLMLFGFGLIGLIGVRRKN